MKKKNLIKTFKKSFKSSVSVVVVALIFITALSLNAFANTPDDAVAADPDTVADTGEGNETTLITEDPEELPAPEPGSALSELIGVDGSSTLEILILITILSVAPSILLMMTSFTRIVIVMGFLRNAMSTQSTPPNQVITGLALFLTMFIMWPTFAQVNEVAYAPYSRGEITAWEAVGEAGKPMKTFMLRQTTNSNMRFFMELADATNFIQANTT